MLPMLLPKDGVEWRACIHELFTYSPGPLNGRENVTVYPVNITLYSRLSTPVEISMVDVYALVRYGNTSLWQKVPENGVGFGYWWYGDQILLPKAKATLYVHLESRERVEKVLVAVHLANRDTVYVGPLPVPKG